MVEPELDPVVTPELDPAFAPEPGPAVTPELDPELAPEPDPAPTADVDPALAPEPGPAPTPDVDPALIPEPDPDVDPALAPELDPAVEGEPGSEDPALEHATAGTSAVANRSENRVQRISGLLVIVGRLGHYAGWSWVDAHEIHHMRRERAVWVMLNEELRAVVSLAELPEGE